VAVCAHAGAEAKRDSVQAAAMAVFLMQKGLFMMFPEVNESE